MANPQVENGYTKIANEIMEALASIRIGPDEWQILMVLFRKTYGWGKKSDLISLSQFAVAAKMRKPHVCRAISKLEKRNIITRTGNGITRTGNPFAFDYALQKDFDLWKPLPKVGMGFPEVVTTITSSGNKAVPLLGTTKERKKLLQKKDASREKTSSSNSDVSDEWIDSLFNLAAYNGVDIHREFDKMRAWLTANPRRKMSRKFAINWLNRAEPTLDTEYDPSKDPYGDGRLSPEQIADIMKDEAEILEKEKAKLEHGG